MTLGNSLGNRFEIVLREISASQSSIDEACVTLRENGFINYFGLQRFGRGGSGSHVIGKEIFRGNWQGVLDLTFSSRLADREESVAAKLAYQNGEFEKALKLLPSSMYAEKCMLQSLSENPRDLYGAFCKAPKSNRLICAHAFQSYIWNMLATKRLELFGNKVVVGDIVALSTIDKSLLCDNETEEYSGKSNDVENSKVSNIGIHTVIPEDVECGRYTMKDVLLPLPGWDIVTPNNAIGEYYSSLLQENGITQADLQNHHVKSMGLYGSYRRLLEFPGNFEWNFIEYSDSNAEIAHTELTDFKIDNSKLSEKENSILVPDSDRDINLSGSKRQRSLSAVLLKFNLSSGTYATMLLRELTKNSTDTDYHAKLTSTSSEALEQV